MAGVPMGVFPGVSRGVEEPIWLAGVSSQRDFLLLAPGVGVSPTDSSPLSVRGVSAQPLPWPGVSGKWEFVAKRSVWKHTFCALPLYGKTKNAKSVTDVRGCFSHLSLSLAFRPSGFCERLVWCPRGLGWHLFRAWQRRQVCDWVWAPTCGYWGWRRASRCPWGAPGSHPSGCWRECVQVCVPVSEWRRPTHISSGSRQQQ